MSVSHTLLGCFSRIISPIYLFPYSIQKGAMMPNQIASCWSDTKVCRTSGEATSEL